MNGSRPELVGSGGVPASGVGAVVLNVTAVQPFEQSLVTGVAHRRPATRGIEPQHAARSQRAEHGGDVTGTECPWRRIDLDLEVETSESAPDTLPPERDRQRSLLVAWLQSDDAVDTAGQLLSRRGVGGDSAELVNAAWVGIHESIARRAEPFPDLTEPKHAAKDGARVLDNRIRDRLRTATRRKEVELLDSFGNERAHAVLLVSRLMLRHLHAAVAEQAQQLDPQRRRQSAQVALRPVHRLGAAPTW